MDLNRNRKMNSSISPLRDHNTNMIEGCSKLTQTATDTDNIFHLKQFTQSPLSTDNIVRKKRGEQIWNCTLSEINYELDNNMNEIIYLLGRRKNLITAKKKRIRQNCQDDIQKAKKSNINLIDFPFNNDSQFLKIIEFCENPKTALSMFKKMIKILPEIYGSKNDEESHSEIFWGKNKKLENEIDIILQKLKNMDKNLEKDNHQVHNICKELDHIEDNLKSYIGAKSNEHVKQVQTLFSNKNQKYNTLNWKIKSRQISRDQKIKLIKDIKGVLEELKITRQFRLNQIAKFFGVDNLKQFENIDFNHGFTSSFEEVIKIKEKIDTFDSSEKQALRDIEILQRQQEKLYTQLLKRQSDEAKAFHSYEIIMNRKIKYTSILSLLQADGQHSTIFTMNGHDLAKKFKDYKGLIARFVEENNLLRQGLLKTSETTKTFSNLLKVTENEKQRRQQLLSLLQTCIHRRVQYEQKKEQVRNINVQQAKNSQQLSQFEEQLQAVLTDGSIEEYKHLGCTISRCEVQRQKLRNLREVIEKQMQCMDRQAIGLINQVQQQYQDILCDIIPSDLQYSLKNGEDVKKLRNHLRKMYKRLGILKTE